MIVIYVTGELLQVFRSADVLFRYSWYRHKGWPNAQNLSIFFGP